MYLMRSADRGNTIVFWTPSSSRSTAPGLRLNLPDAKAVRERVRQRTHAHDGLTRDRHGERPGHDGVGVRALHVPEAQFVGQVLVSDAEPRAPFLNVREPLRWSVRTYPAIRCNPVDDDRGISEQAEEQLVVLRIEAHDVGLDAALQR